MFKTLTVEQALTMPDVVFVDMRSPAEFAEGQLPGAVNIPIFDNQERIEVGILYKQHGTELSKQRGLAIASAKLPSIVQQIGQLAVEDKAIIVYCWRGGMRSRSIATILDLMGIHVYQLIGGYKAFRSHVLEKLSCHRVYPRIVVLHGFTGVGKTTILQMLAEREMPVIDLEKLANHRGSVFGHIGKGQTISAKHFDALLLAQLEAYKDNPYIIVESESKRIGNIYLPDSLVQAMQTGQHILITASQETRVNRLLEEYLHEGQGGMPSESIIQSLQSLQTRLGKAKVTMLQELLMRKEYRQFVEILLVDYYDPLYKYDDQSNTQFDLDVSSEDLVKATDQIVGFLNEAGGKI